MKRTIIVAVFIIAAVAATTVVLWWRSGPDASQFAHLAAPRITHLENQRMLVVEAVGDPNVVAGRAFKLLFAAYFKTEGVSRMASPPAPRARWPQPLETPRSEWVGRYALPVPHQATAAPTMPAEPGLRIGFETWEYGDVAEVLHVGRYSEEEPDIRRLQTFVTASGYRVVGEHEEEYVRGPGMIFAGDPERYLTIIRLRVIPAASEARVER